MVLVLPFSLEGISALLAEAEMPMALIWIVSILQSAVLFAFVIFLGLLLSKKTGLGAHILESYISRERGSNSNNKDFFSISIIAGVLTGIALLAFDYIFYKMGTGITFFNVTPPVWWKGLMASFYGGIAEEILMRLFLLNLFVWLFSKIIKKGDTKQNRPIIWVSIIIAAIIFGAGHLPATAAIAPLTPLIILRAFLLNGAGGIVFGWLFWKRGLLSAMIAHFSADIILHVLFVVFISQVKL